MPSTLSGLALFAALLVPGFVYLERRESREPGHEYTTLRETGQVLLASLVSDGLVLAVFASIRAAAPGLTPDAGALVRMGGAYFRLHYQELLAWGGGGLILSCAFASLVAVPPTWCSGLVSRIVRNSDARVHEAIARRQRPAITHESGWGKAFHLYADRSPYIGLTLRDGTYLAGPLLSFSTQLQENGDRSIVLSSPLEVRYPTERSATGFFADSLVVSAGEISFLTVTYLPDVPAPTPYHGHQDDPDSI